MKTRRISIGIAAATAAAVFCGGGIANASTFPDARTARADAAPTAGAPALTPEQESRVLDAFAGAMQQGSRMTPEQLEQLGVDAVAARQAGRENRMIGLPGPAAILSCAGTVAYDLYRNGGITRDNVMMKLADYAMGCIGIPGAGYLAPKVAKILWNNRATLAAIVKKVSPAMAAIILSATAPR